MNIYLSIHIHFTLILKKYALIQKRHFSKRSNIDIKNKIQRISPFKILKVIPIKFIGRN